MNVLATSSSGFYEFTARFHFAAKAYRKRAAASTGRQLKLALIVYQFIAAGGD